MGNFGINGTHLRIEREVQRRHTQTQRIY